ncbi:MAG: HPr kinase/phosphorylase, partial [Ignavibacteria bacterium]
MKITDKNISRKENITVDFFFNLAKNRCGLELINDQVGFGRLITEQNLHRPGLALAGFMDLFTFNRIQIFGNTEMRYLTKLDDDKRKEILEKFLDHNLPCVIITNGNKPTEDFIQIANDKHVAILGTPLETTKLTYFVSDMLEDQFAPRISIHGSFVDVYGVGMLFVGKSGIGKSEVALDLV